MRSIIETSVIIPAYNAELYIQTAIESVLHELPEKTEVIVINDGSTDGTGGILEALAAKYPALKVYQRESRGMVQTMAELVTLAKGELLIRMDADDICHPGRIAKQIEFLQSHHEWVLVGGQVLFIDMDGRPICRTNLPLEHHDIVDGLYLEGGVEPVPLIHPAVAMRKSAVLRVGNYRPAYPACEDRDLWLRLSEIGKVGNLDEVVLSYRLHFESFSHKYSKQQSHFRQKAIQEARNRTGRDVPSDWRDPMPEQSLSIESIRMRWAKSAANCRNYKTATCHLSRILFARPFHWSTWKATLRICSQLLKHK